MHDYNMGEEGGPNHDSDLSIEHNIHCVISILSSMNPKKYVECPKEPSRANDFVTASYSNESNKYEINQN